MTNPVPNVTNPADKNIGSSQSAPQKSDASYETEYLDNVQTEIKEINTDETSITQEAANIKQLEKECTNERTKMVAVENHDYGHAIRHFFSKTHDEDRIFWSLYDVASPDFQIISGYKSQISSDSAIENAAANSLIKLAGSGTTQIQAGLSALNVALGINSSSADLNTAITFFNTQVTKNGQTTDLGTEILNQILGALKDSIKEKERDMRMKEGNLAQSTLEEDYLENMQDSLQAETLVNAIPQLLQDADTDVTDSINASISDQHDHSKAYDVMHALGFTKSQIADRENIRHGAEQLNAINTVGDQLSSLVASYQTDAAFSQVTSMMNHLIAKMKKIINNPNMTLVAKLNAVLGLMVEALSIFSMLQQDTENQKMENEKKMATANQSQAKNSIQATVLDEQIAAQEQKAEEVAGAIQKVSTWMMVTVAAFSANPAFFAVMLTIAILQSNGDMAKWTNELAAKTGSKWKADLIIAAIEMAAGGVGCIGESAAKLFFKAAVEDAVENAIQNVEQDVISSAADSMSNKAASLANTVPNFAMEIEAMDTLEQTARKSASMAAELVRDEFYNLSIPARLAREFEGQGLKVTLKRVTQEAVSNAIKETVNASANSQLALTQEALEEVSVIAAAQAVSNVTSTSVEDAYAIMDKTSLASLYDKGGLRAITSVDDAYAITNETTLASPYAKGGARAILPRLMANRSPVIRRLLFTFAYGLGNTNSVMDIAKAIAKKKGESLSSVDRIIAGVIQMLVEMIGMIGAMGSSSLQAGGKFAAFQKIATAAQTGGQVATSVSQFKEASAVKTQAQATLAVKEQVAFQALLSSILKEMTQAQNESEKQAMKEWQLETESLNKLAMRLQAGNNAGIRILTESTV